MVNNLADGYRPVRTLTKVRRQFLNKTPDANQLANPTPAAIYQQANGETYTIQASLGFFERGKRLYMGPEFLNIHFNIASSLVENHIQSKVVTLNLVANGNNIPIHWDQTVERLESYGGLEFATWAHRIRNHQANYTKAMSSYYEVLRSQDPQIQAMLRKTQLQATLACREIEAKYPFKKYVERLNPDTYEILSCSYSEGFLNEIGHTAESFVIWAKENGIPKIFESSTGLYEDIIKDFLNYIPAIAQPVTEGNESETTIYNAEGHQRRVAARSISVFEPALGSPLRHCYVILNNTHKDLSELNQRDICGINMKRRVGDFECENADRTWSLKSF